MKAVTACSFRRSVVLVLSGVLLGAVPAVAQASDRLIVGFAPGSTATEQARELRDAGLPGVSAGDVRESDIPAIDAATVEVPEDRLRRVRAQLLESPAVEFVERDRIARAAWAPNDPSLPQQWGLAKVGAQAAWDVGRGSGVKVAVVDSGVSYSHPDLAGKVELGRDFVSGDDDPDDPNGHGTHVAGAVAAIADNGMGIAGAAPNARILAIRVLDQNGSGYYSWIASGITSAADRGAKVINLSLGGTDSSLVLQQAVEYAAARGAIVTCATGNEGAADIGYPARYEGCTAVGATNQEDGRATFSNHGVGIDLVAPGSSILSTVPGGGYEAWDGTSMATPYVSGLAAVLFSRGLSRTQVLAAMTLTARDLGPAGPDTEFGSGRIDAAAAATHAASLQIPPLDAVAPVVTGLDVPGTSATFVPRDVRHVWKQTKVTRWRVVGRTKSRKRRAWQKLKKRAKQRKIVQFRMRRGIVRSRTITQRQVPVRARSAASTPPRAVTVTATDNVAVDRVGLSVDGKFVGTDWNAADGWAVNWSCTSGTHTFVAHAWDASDNGATREVRQEVTC